MIRYSSKICISGKEKDYIKKSLPNFDTDVIQVKPENNFEIFIRINARSREEIQQWINAYQKITRTCYSVETTYKCSGQRVLFKRSYHCQHRTRHKHTYDPVYRKRIKNTNCPSVFTVTIRKITKRYQGKDKTRAPDQNKPCEIRLKLKHNHSTDNVMAKKFKKVLPSVKEELTKLFKAGHTAATALQTIKAEIRLNHENFEEILTDRSKCPDYAFCHYMSQKVKKNSVAKFDYEYLQDRLAIYNHDTKYESCRIGKNLDNTVVCLCPPLVRRVHEYHQNSAEIVFIDSFQTSEQRSTRVYILTTPSEFGVLPLGVIIVNSSSNSDILIGLNALKDMLGEQAFCKNPKGPRYIFTDEHIAQDSLVNEVWPASINLIGSHHILLDVHKWIHKLKNFINDTDKQVYFQDFYNMVYADDENKFIQFSNIAKNNATKYKHYLKQLNYYISSSDKWALCYRPKFDNNAMYSDIALRILHENIFQRLKLFNTLQITDFIINTLFRYFERQSLDIASGEQIRNVFHANNDPSDKDILDKIQFLEHNTRLVPSERVEDLFYVVNTDLLTCTCFNGSSNTICTHIKWICKLILKEKMSELIGNSKIREKYSLIIHGETQVVELFEAIPTTEIQNPQTLENDIVLMETQNEITESYSVENGTMETCQPQNGDINNHDNNINKEFIVSSDTAEYDVNEYLKFREKNDSVARCRENLEKMNKKIEKLLQDDPENLLASLKTIYSRFEVVKTVEDISRVFGVEGPSTKYIRTKTI